MYKRESIWSHFWKHEIWLNENFTFLSEQTSFVVNKQSNLLKISMAAHQYYKIQTLKDNFEMVLLFW